MFITSLYCSLIHCLPSGVYSNIVLSGPVSCSLLNKQTMDNFWVELSLTSFCLLILSHSNLFSFKRLKILKNAQN